jgi:hypothetical protein
VITASVKITKDNVQELIKEMQALVKKSVLVGVPEDSPDRLFSPEEWQNRKEKAIKKQPSNAYLAYVHDQGSPVAGIPARPFMKPGIAKVQNRINQELKAAAIAATNGDDEEVDQRLYRAGLIASSSIKNVINNGEGFVPLTRGTLLARSRKRAYAWYKLSADEKKLDAKQRKALRKQKRETIMGSFHALVDTAQLRNSITFSVEES